MKAALVVNLVTPNVSANLAAILDKIAEAAAQGAELVVFPEAALTGLINDDQPEQDLPLGHEIPGEITRQLAVQCQVNAVWLAIGLLEREAERLYDSAILIAPDGEIKLKYRRISKGWHGPQADAGVYGHGSEIPTFQTPFGTLAFLLCGDLFDDGIIERVRQLHPDWLLLPFARNFDDYTIDQPRWDREEMPNYARRVHLAGVPALMVNYLAVPELEDGSFGGAWYVNAAGEILASLPLGEAGLLNVDLVSCTRLVPR
jgi:predicted amidohydrolase